MPSHFVLVTGIGVLPKALFSFPIVDVSATEFINTIRLKEAQKILLERPELTMAEVAYKVGFHDPNYFSRLFKKMFNISPTSFRVAKADI